MSRTGAIRHTHRYVRTFPNKRRIEPIWRCTLDGCTHFVPYNTTVLGRKSVCWNCADEFVMLEHNLVQDEPTCSLICANARAEQLVDETPIVTIEEQPEPTEDEAAAKMRQQLWDLYENRRKK